MRSGEFIQQKFQVWASRRGIPLQGSAGSRGQPNYTFSVAANLFGGHLCDEARRGFDAGAGGELRGEIPSMQALHSSAAMAINLFQYWIENRQFQTLAKALRVPSNGIKSLSLERKYPVCARPEEHGLQEPPHLDLGIEYENVAERVGVECKLFEPFGRLDHPALASAYLRLPATWEGIPACRQLAEEVAGKTSCFSRLCSAQLLRHLLGLRFGARKAPVRLIYLYYDAPGDEAAEHRDELRRFCEMVEPDRKQIWITPLSVQEFIFRIFDTCRAEHAEYADYLADRYL